MGAMHIIEASDLKTGKSVKVVLIPESGGNEAELHIYEAGGPNAAGLGKEIIRVATTKASMKVLFRNSGL